jgi:DNA-binding transcriptional ArsR family regulator
MVMEILDRESAERYASWFKALADPTRVQLVTLLAKQRRPMTVGEMVSASGVGQSTVSHHLKALGEVRFVLSEQTGTTRRYRINEACVSCFPSAADIVMGRQVPEPPACDASPSKHAQPSAAHVATGRHQVNPKPPKAPQTANIKGAQL